MAANAPDGRCGQDLANRRPRLHLPRPPSVNTFAATVSIPGDLPTADDRSGTLRRLVAPFRTRLDRRGDHAE